VEAVAETMMKNKRHIGRLRIRAAKILSENFPEWDVQPEDIRPATGSWRTCPYHDVYRWELYTRTKTGMPVVCGCWSTLTLFVKLASKYGCHLSRDGTIYEGKE
jgi:hypothetical protein